MAGWITPDLLDLAESLTTLRLYGNFNLSGERIPVHTVGEVTDVAWCAVLAVARVFFQLILAGR